MADASFLETTPIVPLPGFGRLAGLDAAGLVVDFLVLLAFDSVLTCGFGFDFAFALALAFAFGFDFALAM
tara:strand:+ start:1153 stop:1362 length:210 start_codon:yes stop_codon:yes gene_type:complete